MYKQMNIGLETGKELPSGMKNLWDKNGLPNWAIISQKDWFIELSNCPQDPNFHAEGDVATHTQMVVNELLALEDYKLCTPYEQQVLLWAALLHDIAKPQCTLIDEEGYIRAPKHAEVGEKVVRNHLWDLGFEARETICALVRMHGLPIWCLDKKNPHSIVALSSLRLKNKLLYIIAKADVLGRISVGQDDFLERIELFKEFCIEQECWESPKVFYNNHSQFKFFFKQETYPAVVFDDTQFEIIILSGIPGSGKDTYARSLKLPMISLDDIRQELGIKFTDKDGQGKVAQLAYQRAKAFCAKKQSFIWNSTNLTNQLRQRVIATLSVYNPKFKLIYIETSKANVIIRRKADIPIRKIEKMFDILEMPLPHEVHQIEYLRN